MGLTLLSQPAQAVQVTVNSVTYDVTVFTGTYDANVSKFETAANGGEMPWFGDQTLADQFALAVYNLTPTNGGLAGNSPTPGGFDIGVGPFFAWKVETVAIPPFPPSTSTSSSAVSLNQTTSGFPVGNLAPQPSSNSSFNLTYATATPTVVPEPLTLLGAVAAAGFGAAFKRRSRKTDG